MFSSLSNIGVNVLLNNLHIWSAQEALVKRKTILLAMACTLWLTITPPKLDSFICISNKSKYLQ